MPKTRPKIIRKDQVAQLVDACSNLRDKFLIQLLWESGMRIGEALSVWLEDIEADAQKIHIQDRGELSNLAEIKTICSPRTIDVSPDLINLFFDYVAEYHTDDVDTNHVFIKLSGDNKCQPLEYQDVASLFRRLRTKTGIDVTSHILRHTHFAALRKQGWEIEKLQKRGGWSDVQTLMKTYLHPSDEEMRQEWDKVEQKIKLKRNRKDADTDE